MQINLLTSFENLTLGQGRSDEHVDHHADDVVGDGDEGTCCQSGIDLHLIQGHRNQGAEDTGEYHHGEQTQRNSGGDASVAQHEKIIDKYNQADDAGIDQRHGSLFQDLRYDISLLQGVVGQTLHHDRGGLNADISTGATNQGNEQSHLGIGGETALETTQDDGITQSANHADQQPRQAGGCLGEDIIGALHVLRDTGCQLVVTLVLLAYLIHDIIHRDAPY